jgi:hypothetical protein
MRMRASFLYMASARQLGVPLRALNCTARMKVPVGKSRGLVPALCLPCACLACLVCVVPPNPSSPTGIHPTPPYR